MEDPRILVLYTGGTIGMRVGPRGYEPCPGYLEERLAGLAQLNEAAQPGVLSRPLQPGTFRTPPSEFGRHIQYRVIEYTPLLDSSNVGMDDWGRIARDIGKYHDQFDGFLVLHGTDTMAYTASALSFMLEGLRKPVILTGSQIPIAHPRTDAVDNLIGALTLAGHFEIPEVCLYFRSKLFRGNRVQKQDAEGLDAFQSGNFPPLAHVGTNISVRWELVRSPSRLPFHAHVAMDPHVAALRLFPGIPPETLANFLREPLRGVVLETYGAGNAPDRRADFLAVLRQASDRGVVIVNCTQCHRGTVRASYAAGTALAEAGVVGGGDMTPEAALTKLSFLFGQGLCPDDVRSAMQRSLRGERSTDQDDTRLTLRDRTFVNAVARALGEDRAEIAKVLHPLLLCAAAGAGDLEQVRTLLDEGADPSVGDYDGRTPLHLAASEGRAEVVGLLCARGAKLDACDRWGGTPADDAIRQGHILLAAQLTTSD